MKTIYLVTGANGHLGSAVCAALCERAAEVRALVLPGENVDFLHSLGVQIVRGNVCNIDELETFFDTGEHAKRIVIHCAGIVNITENAAKQMESVNIGGTKNILEMCKKHKVSRLIYVSSVHAIPTPAKGRVIRETKEFSPALVDGAYAKTKAAATALVLDSVKEGVPAIVVHPSGIVGPYLGGGNHLVQMIRSYITGKLPAIVKGGYDFVDVRDCADGILSAISFGRVGECYILSNRYYEIYDILNMARRVCKVRRALMLPMWMAKLAEPFIALVAKLRRKKPLYTKYSLKTLESNDKFSHDKATKELGYYPRDLFRTVKDTVYWLVKSQKNKKIKLRG